jgi:DNA anti-recombination protein RmuC
MTQAAINFISTVFREILHPLFEDVKDIKKMASEILTGIQAEDAEIQKLDAQISQVVSDYESAAQVQKDAFSALEDKYNTLLAQSGTTVDPAELAQEKQAIADSTAKVDAIIARLQPQPTSQPAADPQTPASQTPASAQPQASTN